MEIIGKANLHDAIRKYSSASKPLRSWLSEAKDARWRDPRALEEQYPSANINGNNQVVFKIEGDDYLLVTEINYERGLLDIRFFGARAEWDCDNAVEV